MDNNDIRWQQRFNNYKKALAKLGEVAANGSIDDLSDLEKEGLIHRFEYTFELAWKTFQDLLFWKGYEGIVGPNPVLQQALHDGYIIDESTWRNMKKSRELTSHTYDDETANNIARSIVGGYYNALLALKKKLEEEIGKKTA
jgi:nucleotidyltransferase substrate binding protein (TIGR01987 family)